MHERASEPNRDSDLYCNRCLFVYYLSIYLFYFIQEDEEEGGKRTEPID